jgi:hypothetical protein
MIYLYGHFAPVAQWIEQSRPKGKIVGSTPIGGTLYITHTYLSMSSKLDILPPLMYSLLYIHSKGGD